MQKGFGSTPNKRFLKDSRYLKFYNDEKYAADLLKNKKIKEAKNIYLNLLKSEYQSYEIFFNLGFIEKNQKNYREAVKYLTKAKSFTKENNLNLLFGLVNSYISLNDIKEARLILDEAIDNNPKSDLLIFNYAKLEEDLLNFKKAIKLYEKGLKLNTENYKALSNLAGLYQKMERYSDAIEAYKRAIKLQPQIAHLKLSLLTCKSFACDWSEPKYIKNTLKEIDNLRQEICPFDLLYLEDNPSNNLKKAKHYFESKYKRVSQNLSYTPKTKIRVGYFSADFRKHALMYLMKGLFELHDKEQFDVYIYSLNSEEDELTDELKRNVNVFRNISDISDEKAAFIAREDSLDIAVDLMGYMKKRGLSIFSLRVAPIQISYLGYPGTTGSDDIDYLIADKVIIPYESRKFYSEKVIYMPNCYQCNDSNRKKSTKEFSKTELGLPENAFVFACFNANNKITSVEFDIWMRLLKKLKNSVLWLYKSNDYSAINLKKESENRGVESSRIIFADMLRNEEHLSRIKCADLFLDTFNFNAHTTASDALWSGVPVITKQGKSFPARVCSSLLTSLGLEELIVHDNEEYEDKAYRIATNRIYLEDLKYRLNQSRTTSSLFDTKRFTRNLEEIFFKLVKNL
ncbi:tetratricopeptide repeat protein [Prochlorococcus sp. AH-716-I05]|nr:tetratricopeptide repeat protein [Prochlorococcus sp. AH-716-I05]